MKKLVLLILAGEIVTYSAFLKAIGDMNPKVFRKHISFSRMVLLLHMSSGHNPV